MNINLPPSTCSTSYSLEHAIDQRRSCREYSSGSIQLEQLSQLLWSAQGVTGFNGQRSGPSAGAQYPLELYISSGNIEGVPIGTYKYLPQLGELQLLTNDDLRDEFCEHALGDQPWVAKAAIVMVIAANFRSMREHFQDQPPQGRRGERYVFLESGAVVQNVHLQATALDLGAVLVGGFNDDNIKKTLNLPFNLEPTALICIGKNCDENHSGSIEGLNS